MKSGSEPRKFFSPPRGPSSSRICGGGQNLLALQFLNIVTLYCKNSSIKKSSADLLARNKI